MKIYLYLIIVMFLISCSDPLKEKGRINPLDSNGDNWFPPVVQVDVDTVSGKTNDYTILPVTAYDFNSRILKFKWYLENDSIIDVDSVKFFTDSLIGYDTLISIDTAGYDTLIAFDTSEIKSNILNVDKKEVNGVITFFLFSIDSADTQSVPDTLIDTITFSENSDTVFIEEIKDSFSVVSQVITNYDTIPTLDTVKTAAVNTVYYLYSSKLIFTQPDTFQLFVKAIDEDGLESERADSVIVFISE